MTTAIARCALGAAEHQAALMRLAIVVSVTAAIRSSFANRGVALSCSHAWTVDLPTSTRLANSACERRFASRARRILRPSFTLLVFNLSEQNVKPDVQSQ